jgi:hypothetical protein
MLVLLTVKISEILSDIAPCGMCPPGVTKRGHNPKVFLLVSL